MNIKRICQFLLDKERDKPDAKLRYRIKWNNSHSIVSRNVGYRIDIDKWSMETQRCKNNTTHGKRKISAGIINKEIQRIEGVADEVFAHFELSGKTPSAVEFRIEFDRLLHEDSEAKGQGLFDAYESFIKKTREMNSWSEKTVMRHENAMRHLQRYNPRLTFGDLTEDVLLDFTKYLQTPGCMLRFKEVKRGMKNSTVAKNIEQLREFLRWAKKNGYNRNGSDDFHPKLKTANNELIYLSWGELTKLYNFDFKKKYLSRVRDVFCFMCFTSLRYSDVAKLTRLDVKDDHIRVITKKTVDGLKIDLNKYSRTILEKYREEAFPENKALPVISNVEMNRYLKEMGEVAGFNEPMRTVYFIGANRYEEVKPKYALLTTHCGRRTFVVNSLYLEIPAEVVMSWTGHADYDSMRPYIKIVDELKSKAMKKFDEKLVPPVENQGLKQV
ncbi:MAG: site-specific integrase [Prevotellaceae bacterium]|jgi:integrase|nr:site-specific integrase [Prevotellaceae bacterium]